MEHSAHKIAAMEDEAPSDPALFGCAEPLQLLIPVKAEERLDPAALLCLASAI